MANANDTRILELKKQIEEKKEKLGKVLRFSPITNCSLELDGQRKNIHALSKEELVLTLVKLQSYLASAKELEIEEHLTISGYHVTDWIADFKAKFEVLNTMAETKKLKAMEAKLVQLLSEGKKVELELDDIASMLNN